MDNNGLYILFADNRFIIHGKQDIFNAALPYITRPGNKIECELITEDGKTTLAHLKTDNMIEILKWLSHHLRIKLESEV